MIVRYGPNRISVNNADAIETIYGTQANTQKSSLYYGVFSYFFPYPSTETIIDKNRHAVKRRALARALSEKSLKHLEPSFLKNVRLFCAELVEPLEPHGKDSRWARPRDVAESTAHLSFDVMGDICFGQSFDMIQNSEKRNFIDVISDGAQGLNIVRVADTVSVLWC